MCVPIKKNKFICTDAKHFNTVYIPRSCESLVQLLRFKTVKNTKTTDVKNQAHVGTWKGWHPF